MLRPKSLPYEPDYQIYSMERDWYFRIVIALIVLMPVVACRLEEDKGETKRCVMGVVQQHAAKGASAPAQAPQTPCKS
jgi:hypothetical protein